MTPLALVVLALAADPAVGVLPLGADDKPLNLDFETGTLKDWTAAGDAFRGQPVKGDRVAARRADMKSRHQGEYWIGGFEQPLGDKATGTLTSVAFAVTHPWATFRVGGGPHPETCVEIVATAGGDVIFRASGAEAEDMGLVAVDLTKHAGKQIQVRVVDTHSGHWGHVNFDDFRFHAAKPDVPVRATAAAPTKADEYAHAGLKPLDAAKAMTVPPGFTVKLFAGEPDVHQPIGFCFDDRGRVWVAEAYVYPKRQPHPGPLVPDSKSGDRIRILEDTDGDGTFDKATTVIEGLNLVSGIEIGFGGVWVGAAPYLMFIPIDAATDKPTGPPQILLDGWGYEDTHETLNSFVWGPDGWLYGCHGVFTHSRVGKPGTPDKDRTPINAGVWRYHPTRHVFEVYAYGTSNPWGLDYNARGDWFVEACVIPHNWHIVQGGRYERQAGRHFDPNTYVEIPTIAKHRHWQGANQWAGNAVSGSLGGGHAHSGTMIYQGGHWPKEYAGKMFMGNIHGHRINVDVLTPKGAGYEADRNPDFLLTNDKSALIVAIKQGPDGNAFFCDWYDKQSCHRNEPEIWDRSNGRIYKIEYQGTTRVKNLDLQRCTDEELAAYQTHANDWYARHARRILQERAVTGRMPAEASKALTRIATESSRETHRLRAMWALHATEYLPAAVARDTTSPLLLAWGITLQSDSPRPGTPAATKSLAARAINDDGPVFRRAIASLALTIPPADRFDIVAALVSHEEDAADPVLPYLYWYAAEPLAAVDPTRALDLAANAKIPTLLPLMARRVATLATPAAADALVDRVIASRSDDARRAYLAGLKAAVAAGWTHPVPARWPLAFAKVRASREPETLALALAVGVGFRDETALAAMRTIAADGEAKPAAREEALAALLGAKDPAAREMLFGLVKTPGVRASAVRGLAAFEDARTGPTLVAAYPQLSPAEKRDAVNTLAARPGTGFALLAAVAAKSIPAADVPAETIRQLRNLKDAKLDARIAAVWGTVRDTPADRKALIATWAKTLAAPAKVPPDVAHGRAVFNKVCQQCHVLYGVGGKVGPEITGSNRANLDYLLENIFDPSAVIPKEYAATKLDLADGRVVIGIVRDESAAGLVVQTATETLTIPVKDVEKRTPSAESMMPADLTKQLADADVRALIAYLRTPQQTPMRATAENAKDFFNGKTLDNWDGDKTLWTVIDGEIVGKTATGLKKNNFLISQLEVTDFKLTLKVKLSPDTENSGIQFRSVPIEGGEMRGAQADIGAGWWGKLYEESARGLLSKPDGDKFVKVNEYNDYVVEAVGGKVKTWLNGNLCTDIDDDKLAKKGLIAVQLHSGKPMEVRFKDIKLEVK